MVLGHIRLTVSIAALPELSGGSVDAAIAQGPADPGSTHVDSCSKPPTTLWRLSAGCLHLNISGAGQRHTREGGRSLCGSLSHCSSTELSGQEPQECEAAAMGAQQP